MDKQGRGTGFSAELPHFQRMWDKRGEKRGRVKHTAERWEKRAEEWIGETGGRSETERVNAAAAYLRARGLLRENDTVVDVGCGPGSFVMEFAKTVKHAAGMDFSARFVDYARETALSRGISNASFECRDILALDVGAEGLTGAFDLVFTSITPAATAKGSLQKLMDMSRAFCCNVSVAYSSDSLIERVARDVYGGEARSRHDGMGFYTLYNLLLLSGYYPETYYFTVETAERAEPGTRLAADVAFELRMDSEDETEKILRYLEKTGETERRSVTRYGSVLWDTRIRDER